VTELQKVAKPNFKLEDCSGFQTWTSYHSNLV